MIKRAQAAKNRGGGRDPNPGLLPHWAYAALVGGPWGSLLRDIAGWQPERHEETSVCFGWRL